MGSGERKKAEAATNQQMNIASTQADVSRGLIEQARPWTTIAGKYYGDVLKGGDSLTKAVAPQVNAVTGQYAVAKKAAAEMPLGGSRDRAMRDLRLGEATTKSSIYSGGVQDALGRIAELGQTGTSTGMGGYSAAGAGYSGAAKAFSDLAAGKSGAAGGMGQAGGALGAAGIAAIAA